MMNQKEKNLLDMKPKTILRKGKMNQINHQINNVKYSQMIMVKAKIAEAAKEGWEISKPMIEQLLYKTEFKTAIKDLNDLIASGEKQ